MDLIDRQAAINAIKHNQDIYSNNFGGDAIDKYTVAIIANDIKTLINLSPAERQGRWTFDIDNRGWSWDYPYVCDQCGEWVEKVFNFCPNCGARMEAGE